MSSRPKPRVKPVLLVALALALVAALAAGLVVVGRKATPVAPSAVVPRGAEMVTFIGKHRPFTLRLPAAEGWAPRDAPAGAPAPEQMVQRGAGGKTVAFHQVPDLMLQRSHGGVTVAVQTVDLARTVLPVGWRSMAAARNDNMIYEGEAVHTEFDGEPALVARASNSTNGVRMALRVLAVSRDDILYVVFVGAPVSGEQPDADAVFRGFTLPPKGSLDDRPTRPFDVARDGPEPRAPDTAFDLAVRSARAGSVDAAIHWLQRASDDDGVAEIDVYDEPALEPVRDDQRWPVLKRFLRANQRYWSRHPALSEHVELPPGHEPGRPVRVVVVMPGAVAAGDPFLRDWMKDQARLTNSVLLGVTGPRGVGRRACAWSEDVDEDTARVEGALARLSGRVTIKKGSIVLAGWADGGKMATAIASRHPQRFAGALSLVPATNLLSVGGGVSDVDGELTGRRFMLIAGRAAGEARSLQLADEDGRVLQARGATVERLTYEDAKAQLFGRDIELRFHRWVEFVTSGKKP